MTLLLRLLHQRLGLKPTHKVLIQRGVKVRTPDGAELLTDLYLGNVTTGAPTIMVRSPYGRSVFLAAFTAYPFAAQGFNVVLQSCRGTFGSTGVFDPHHDEQRDGLTTIEWIKQQSWYNGSIATYGPSYLGYAQWAVAAVAGSELKAMAMQATQADFAQMTYAGNSLALQNALTWTHMTMMMRNQRLLALRFILPWLRSKLEIKPRQWLTLPLDQMDAQVVGERVPFWQDWMQHSSANDPWWAPMNHHRTISDVKRPVSMVAGWYDIFIPYQMRDFSALRAAGCESRITIGPWRHTDSELSQAGVRDALEWFNDHLLGKHSTQRQKPVKLFVIGADEWREFDAWPPREALAERWYLQPNRKLVNQLAAESPADQYVYDPADPTPAVGGPALMELPFSVDNAAHEARPDVLAYTSSPLAQPRDLIGAISAELYVTSSTASADFFVRLCDVDQNGKSMNICDGLQRVSVCSSAPQRVPVEMWPTAYRLQAGHSLRVQISSGASPRWARNTGGSEPFTAATTLHRATQSIHHSPHCPSSITLPFCPLESGQ
jgi:putative CocE/NonD family hydrolase